MAMVAAGPNPAATSRTVRSGWYTPTVTGEPMALATLNRGYGVAIARNYRLGEGDWPVVLLHSPGMAYAFDSHDDGLDSPAAAAAMLEALGLHPLADPYAPPPPSEAWVVHLDRDDDDPRPGVLIGPHPVAPIGPLSSGGRVDAHWRAAAQAHQWQCQLMVVWGVDLLDAPPSEVPEQMCTAAAESRCVGATIRVLP